MVDCVPRQVSCALATLGTVVLLTSLVVPAPSAAQDRISTRDRDAVVQSIRSGRSPAEVEATWRAFAFRRGVTDPDRRTAALAILETAVVLPVAVAVQNVHGALEAVAAAVEEVHDHVDVCRTLEEQLDELARSEPEAPVAPTDPAQVAAYYAAMNEWLAAVAQLNEDLQECLVELQEANDRYDGTRAGVRGAAPPPAAVAAVEQSVAQTESATRAFEGILRRATAVVAVFVPRRRTRP